MSPEPKNPGDPRHSTAAPRPETPPGPPVSDGGGTQVTLPVGIDSEVTRVVDQFASLWGQGIDPPQLAGFLPPPGDPRRLPLLEHLLRADLENRLAMGYSVDVADYLRRYPELDPDHAAGLVVHEYHLRRAAGVPVTPELYRGRFPWLDAQLQRLLIPIDSNGPTLVPGQAASITGTTIPLRAGVASGEQVREREASR